MNAPSFEEQVKAHRNLLAMKRALRPVRLPVNAVLIRAYRNPLLQIGSR